MYEGYSGGGINVVKATVAPSQFQNLDQEALNTAVKEGYCEGGGVRSGFYAALPSIPFSSGNVAGGEEPEDVLSADWEETTTPVKGSGDKSKYQFMPSNMQPVGIIDLECYTAVNRSKVNPTVLEVAGDAVTNPDLRSFYFQSANVEEAESWTKALLSDRHQSLKDETEAYRQVCDSFPLQLQACSEMIDAAEKKASEKEKEAYDVRCSAEEGRRKVVNAVREVLERECWEQMEMKKSKLRGGRNGFINDAFSDHSVSGRSRSSRSGRSDCSVDSTKESSLLDSVLDEQYSKLEINRCDLLRELEATLSSPTTNVVQPVQTLADYATIIASTFFDLRVHLKKYEKNLSQSVLQDQTELNKLKIEIQKRDAMLDDNEKRHAEMSSEMKSQLDQYKQEVVELTKQLDAQRMEFSMYQNSTKNKVSELQQHKKILKKEVIELRKKIDECGSETTTVAHKYEKIKSNYQAEKDRNATLERYIERLEKQVGVQQNMMEMMSTGGASFIGKTVGPGLTQCESKDNISLSGISVGSHYRRDSSSVVGGESTMEGTTKSRPKSRTLLPPESSKRHKPPIDQISPMKSPTAPVDDKPLNTKDEERDASTVYYRSETTTEVESPTEDTESAPARKRNPSISLNCENLMIETETLSPLKNDEPVLSQHSTESNRKAHRSPARSNKVEPSIKLEQDKTTPVQSNSLLDETIPSPSIGTTVEELPPMTTFPPTDPDDEEDVKSRVSDITEDRTQRQIDEDLIERRKIMLAYLQGNSGGGSSNLSISASTRQRLETIENMLPKEKGEHASRSINGRLPRCESLASLDGSHGGSSQESGKLSLAQRMRLEADNRSNIHRSPSPMRPKEDTPSTTSHNAPIRSASPATLEKSGSFFSKLGKSIENLVDNTIVGVKSYDSDEESGSVSASESASEKSKPQSQVSQLTLKERIAMQRQKQVEFLKNKGVIDDESSLHGGAGGSSIASPRATTPSNRLSTPRRGVGRTWSRS